jgi:ferric-dicitrate binding protein FerR (iron transport regulator)
MCVTSRLRSIRTRFRVRRDLRVDLILACLHTSVSVSVHSAMEWVQGKILDFIYTTKCLVGGTRTNQTV